MNTKGIIYVMTTAVSGLIKIGKTESKNFQERMRNLEANGYYNVAGLKRFFAIELYDYSDKEKLLHELFNKHQVGNSELFALDTDLIRQLLLSFDGKVIYPEKMDKEKEFDVITKVRKQGALFSFYRKGLKNGDIVNFIKDNSIKAKVVGEREVEYMGQIWKLSPLAYKIYESRGQLVTSGTYQGAHEFEYNGKRLTTLPDKI
ncbi:MAG: GIY-YIG nuclease family protein [Rickettsiales bacterium]|jgi:hypothetical protein|nr:GIY-YIG nuclease family protein [Rickettsiales bacterium]